MNVKKMSMISLMIAGVLSGAAHAEFVVNTGEKSLTSGENKAVDTAVRARALAKVKQGGLSYGFKIEDGSKPAWSQGVMETGIASVPGLTLGMANDVSLLTALKQVIPQGWKAKKEGEINLNTVVNWRGGKKWTEVLNDLAVENNFKALVDWDRQEVILSPGEDNIIALNDSSKESDVKETVTPITATTPSAVKPGATKINDAFTEKEKVSQRVKQLQSTLQKPLVEPSKEWILKSNLSLKENIEKWGKEAGWTISWDAANYPVPADMPLSGAFDDEVEGPIAQIHQAYKAAAQPLDFFFYTKNKVLRVENASYQQSEKLDRVLNPHSTH